MKPDDADEVRDQAKRLLRNIEESLGTRIEGLGEYEDYSEIAGRCCENVVGYKRMPVGVDGRGVLINGRRFFIPVATTEGALVASMCRGIKLMNACGGVEGYVENVGITRGFAMRFGSFQDAVGFYRWIRQRDSVEMLRKAGNSGSRYLDIRRVESKHVVGNEVHVKVHAFTGDAMGMNMITRGCEQIAEEIARMFPGSRLVCISSNICMDKKWSAESYCNGRGRRVFLSIEISQERCREILRVGTEDVFDVYQTKVVAGGSLVLGGFNCQAANYVAGMFLALGQDMGHVVESSSCILNMRMQEGSLLVSLTMPSVIVGLVGGGTHLEPGRSLLQQFREGDGAYLLSDDAVGPGYLALAVGAAVLAGELSLLGALADNTLMKAHMALNRR